MHVVLALGGGLVFVSPAIVVFRHCLAAASNISEDRTTCAYSGFVCLLARQLLRCTGELPLYHGVHGYHFQVHVLVRRKRRLHMAS
jgi:hypothetical protein